MSRRWKNEILLQFCVARLGRISVKKCKQTEKSQSPETLLLGTFLNEYFTLIILKEMKFSKKETNPNNVPPCASVQGIISKF